MKAFWGIFACLCIAIGVLAIAEAMASTYPPTARFGSCGCGYTRKCSGTTTSCPSGTKCSPSGSVCAVRHVWRSVQDCTEGGDTGNECVSPSQYLCDYEQDCICEDSFGADYCKVLGTIHDKSYITKYICS